MANIEVPRTQAFLGLSIMYFCTLAFHACARSLYTSSSDPSRPPPHSPLQDIDLTSSQFTTLMETLESLSQTITQVNSSLHSRIDHEFSLLQRTGSWRQHQPATFGRTDGVIAGTVILGIIWFLGTSKSETPFDPFTSYICCFRILIKVMLIRCSDHLYWNCSNI